MNADRGSAIRVFSLPHHTSARAQNVFAQAGLAGQLAALKSGEFPTQGPLSDNASLLPASLLPGYADTPRSDPPTGPLKFIAPETNDERKPARCGRIHPLNRAWLANLPPEEIGDPGMPMIDSHHHLWDRLPAALPQEQDAQDKVNLLNGFSTRKPSMRWPC